MIFFGIKEIELKKKRNIINGKIDDKDIGQIDMELKFQFVRVLWVKKIVDEFCMFYNVFNEYIKYMEVDINYYLLLMFE